MYVMYDIVDTCVITMYFLGRGRPQGSPLHIYPCPYNDWGERQLNEPEQARQPETETAQRSPAALV